MSDQPNPPSANQRSEIRDHKSPLPHVRLERHIDISAYGCEVMAAGDINGDGRAEFVFFQSAGMLTMDDFKPGSTHRWYGPNYTTPVDQALDCVTAIDLHGRVLWQRGAPWRESIRFRTHGGHEMLQAVDVNGDGRKELIRLRGPNIELMDGATGAAIAQADLGADGHSSIFTGNFFGDGGGRQIILKPCSDGLPGHPYGCPVLLLDHRLKPVWMLPDFANNGHTPVAFDVDGDGRDELLVGPICVNPDGSTRWRLPIAKEIKGHDDRREIADVDGDGEMEQVLAFEDGGLTVSDLRGNIKWSLPSDHCGEAVVGKFYSDRPGLQVMFNNETWRLQKETKHKFGSMMVDGQGKEIWRDDRDMYATAIDWPTAVGPQALFAKPHAADPPDARPFIMDGSGKTIAEFDLPKKVGSVDPKTMPHKGISWGDWGDYYSQKMIDLEGVGQRLLIWTRRDLWVFKMEV